MAKTTLQSEIPDKFGGVINQEALGRYVDRIERLHVDRDVIAGDIKSVYAEAKSAGFVTGIIRQIVRERRMEEDERHDHYALLDSYRRALGMVADLPLGQAAMDRAAAEAPKPRRFAEQPVITPRRPRGRPRKTVDEALGDARLHLGQEEPAGTA